MDAELGGKRLQLLRELMPNLLCVGVLAATPATDGGFGEILVKDLDMAATRAGLRLAPVLVEGPNEFEGAFEAMSKLGAQAVITQPLFEPHGVILVELATKHHLALEQRVRDSNADRPGGVEADRPAGRATDQIRTMSGTRQTTVAGGLVSMSSDFSALYERAAFYVDKILNGAKPADLPVEQPTKFQVVLNMKTVQALGLTISPTLLAQTNEVIE